MHLVQEEEATAARRLDSRRIVDRGAKGLAQFPVVIAAKAGEIDELLALIVCKTVQPATGRAR